MKRFGVLLATLVMTLGLLGMGPRADAAASEISTMDFQIQIAANGVLDITQSFTMEFGASGGHGPYLTLPTRQGLKDDPRRWRVLSYAIQGVTSPSGAPVQVSRDQSAEGVLALRIGSPSQTVYNSQKYVVKYKATGIINPKVASSGMDELFYNIVGQQWDIPIRNITATVTGPADVQQVQCWTGSSFNRACTSSAKNGDAATYTQSQVTPGEGLAIVAGWPAGTFQGAEPTYTTRTGGLPPFELTPLTGLGSGAGLLGALGLLYFVRRKGKDDAFLGLTPGLVPTQGSAYTVGKATDDTVAVQFTPPPGHPGEIGTVIDERADMRDVTATIVDLAVRGYMRMEDAGGDNTRLVRLNDKLPETRYEQTLINDLFATSTQTTTDDLKDTTFATTLTQVRTELDRQVVQNGWFTASPAATRSKWTVLGLMITVASGFGGFMAMGYGLGLLAIPFGILGLGLMVLSGSMPHRTAEGRAVYTQAKGFELYLSTAEADQIRWEEGEDIFSRYLPYAIAFDCADRWSKVFAEIAASGRPVPQPTWYIGPGFYGGNFGSSFDRIGQSLSGLNDAAASAMTSASTGSSGGSGFSSGGFGGGGGGGMGGGGGGGW